MSDSPDKTAPQIAELDLFVTSTDANGAISTVYDDLGHAIDIKNHRALFKLSYRGERKNDMNAPAADLAKLCRMTSCFPVAFEPVRVTAAENSFFRWGRLRHPAVYLDGGILNNKPFTSTIDAIATRTATRAVERFLIYVEPNPERFAPSSAIPGSVSPGTEAYSVSRVRWRLADGTGPIRYRGATSPDATIFSRISYPGKGQCR